MLKLQTTKSFVKNNMGYVISTIYNQIIEYSASSEIGKLASTAGDE
jgi:type III secretory pathway component EscT